MSKISYFVGGVMGLAIASTFLMGASAQGCFLSKSVGEGIGENQASHSHITDLAKNKPLALVAGLAGIGGLGIAGMMLKSKASALVNSGVTETPELDYEVETVVTNVTAELDPDLEGSDRTLTSVG
jgi:hypothetical protein